MLHARTVARVPVARGVRHRRATSQTAARWPQGEGLPLAYALLTDVPGDRSVVVLTDGDMGIGQRRKQLWSAHDLDAQVAPQLRVGTALQVIDMGTDEPYAGPPLSEASHGEHRRVTSPAELRRALDRITAGSRPVATAVKLDVTFDPARVRAYRQLGDDLFERGPATRKRAPGLSLRSGEAATAVYELIPASSDDGPLLTITARASTPRARLELRQTLRNSRIQGSGSANFRLAAALTGLGLLLAERLLACPGCGSPEEQDRRSHAGSAENAGGA